MEQHELTLDQMLADPIVRQLMARDGVAEADVRGLAARVRPRLEGGPLGVWSEVRSFSPEPRGVPMSVDDAEVGDQPDRPVRGMTRF